MLQTDELEEPQLVSCADETMGIDWWPMRLVREGMAIPPACLLGSVPVP